MLTKPSKYNPSGAYWAQSGHTYWQRQCPVVPLWLRQTLSFYRDRKISIFSEMQWSAKAQCIFRSWRERALKHGQFFVIFAAFSQDY